MGLRAAALRAGQRPKTTPTMIEKDAARTIEKSDTRTAHPRLADVLALSASAFRPDAQVAANGSRVYVLLPDSGRAAPLVSWIRGTIATLRTESKNNSFMLFSIGWSMVLAWLVSFVFYQGARALGY